jgi:hypothetical protein
MNVGPGAQSVGTRLLRTMPDGKRTTPRHKPGLTGLVPGLVV